MKATYEKLKYIKEIIRRGRKDENDSNNHSSQEKSQKYFVIQSLKDLVNLEKKIQKTRLLSVDTETNSLNANSAELVGISISISATKAYYIPIKHLNGNNLEEKKVLNILKPYLED